MNTQYIEIKNLVKSPLNARRTVGKKACDELKASILAHGLMQNLVVTEHEDGIYHVIAGARRLVALQALQKAKKLPQDHAVPCQVVSEDRALEMSLAENTVRAAMHPADEFEAFAELADNGQTPEEIATSFGTTAKHVLQRLKLGKVAPGLLAEYRAEQIDLDCLMAFAITDDHKRQMSVYKSLQGWQKGNARHIRGCLTEQMTDSDDKLAKFVTLEAYQAAGGKAKADLFGEDVYLEDTALLQRLAGEKLEAEAAKLRQEGWGWVEIGELDYTARTRFGRIQAVPLDAPAEIVAELEAGEAEQTRIAEQIDAAYEAEGEDEKLVEGLEAQATAIEEKLEEITERLNSFADFDPEQMKSAGCFVSVGYHGKLEVEKGMVRPEDKKTLAKTDGGDEDDDQPTEKSKGLSEPLKRDLEAYRLGVAQLEIATHPAIAFDLLVYKVAKNALTMRSSHDGPQVSFMRNYAGTASAEARKFLTSQMEPVAKTLPVAWLKHDSEADQFQALCDLPQFQKQSLLAYCVALTLQPKLDSGKEPTAYDIALSQTGANVADYWRPTKDSYLSRITTSQLLEIGQQIFGGNFSSQYGKSKKGELVALLDKAFADPDKALDPDKVRRLVAWLPEGMAFPAMPEPSTANAKKGKKVA